MHSSWVLLAVAGLLEVVWAVTMKLSQGFTRVGWSVVTVFAMIGSMGLLALATRDLPIGTAYAAWVGIGAAGTAIAGIVLLHEPVTVPRIFFLALLVVALVGLKASTPA
ncbi:MAG TPA: multidrug efflux SMR transporter [Sandaracinaceae bacterium]